MGVMAMTAATSSAALAQIKLRKKRLITVERSNGRFVPDRRLAPGTSDTFVRFRKVRSLFARIMPGHERLRALGADWIAIIGTLAHVG